MSLAKRLTPSPYTILATAVTALILNRGHLTSAKYLARLSLVQRAVALVFLLNWRSWPFVWHIQLFGFAFVFLFLLRYRMRS